MIQIKPHMFSSPKTQTKITMRCTLCAALLLTATCVLLFAFSSHNLSPSADIIHRIPIPSSVSLAVASEQFMPPDPLAPPISTVAVLMPAWEVLLIVSPETQLSVVDGGYSCVFHNNATSAATFAGTLPSPNRTAFYCRMPESVRRIRPLLQPTLCNESRTGYSSAAEMMIMRWTFLVYDTISTQNDVVLFAKGINRRQGVNRPPSEFRCVFSSGNDAVITAVTSSAQEVFRCPHPDLTASTNGLIKISLQIVDENLVVPSVAYYTPARQLTTQSGGPIHALCACTMVYNVAKVLREWVMYHSKIGVARFFLYDNDSDDNLRHVVSQLNEEGYNLTTTFWMWPKTQEAGFSHAAVYAKPYCKWMMYTDVDEFVFAPYSWSNSPAPSKQLLTSLLPKMVTSSNYNINIGQVSIGCNEFGPSNQTMHPLEGVTQGYTCRRRLEQRHKSIVLLDAVDHSLQNAIHHFEMKKEFRSKLLSIHDAVVNHYKYQAWPEFQTKFRRRVSAYVVDWTQAVNPNSKDRTPGLGFRKEEPKDWVNMFCEVRDERLKMLTQRWFGNSSKMMWQS